MHFISRFGKFHEDFTLKEGTVPSLLVAIGLSTTHIICWILGEGFGLLKSGSLSLSLSLSAFTSLSLSPLSLSLSLSLYLSYLFLPFYISPSTFLSLSLVSIILFCLSNGRFRSCYIKCVAKLGFTYCITSCSWELRSLVWIPL